MGRSFDPQYQNKLKRIGTGQRLARSPGGFVRLSRSTSTNSPKNEDLVDVVGSNLGGFGFDLDGHGKRIRQAAARLASHLPDLRLPLLELQRPGEPSAALTKALAAQWRDSTDKNRAENVHTAVSLVTPTGSTDTRREATRLLVRALGDFNLKDPHAEVYSPYSLQRPINGFEKEVDEARRRTREGFPCKIQRVDIESARFLAMVEDDDDATPPKVAAMWTPKSSATLDMHYLIVYSRLRGKRDDKAAAQVADAASAWIASSKVRPASATSRTGTLALLRFCPTLSNMIRV